MNDNIIKVIGLGATAQNKDIFNDVNFEINAGEIVGLLGHNGSGKSTMLRLLANLERPMQGTVELIRETLDINIHTKDVVIIPDTVKLINNLTIRQNFNVITSGYDYDEVSFAKYLKAIRLDENQNIGDLSKGNQEIVQMVIYFSINTKLYLLDEPFSAVDIYRRELIQKLILDVILRNENSAIIITTHLIDEVENLLERILYINNGSIEIDSKVEQLVAEAGSLKEFLKDHYKMEVGYDEII